MRLLEAFSRENETWEMMLWMAARNGDLEGVHELLRRHRPSPHQLSQHDHTQSTPLYHAASQGHLPIVQALLDAGAPVDDGHAITPLQGACFRGHEHILRLLLERGASQRPSVTGDIPLFMATSLLQFWRETSW